jgi:eukaryotic-like serine/threonine-protein kinase
LILGCLAKNPDDRPTAEEVRSRLDEEIHSAEATQPTTPVPAAAPAGVEQTRATPSSSPPTDRPVAAGRQPQGRRGLLAALAVVAVLVVIGVLAATNLLGDGGAQNAGSSVGGQNGSQGGGDAGPSGRDQGGGQQQGAASTASAGQSVSAPSPDIPEQGEFTAQSAEQTVEAFYTRTSEGDYDTSARLLTESWRQEWFPDQATFHGTFDKVESVVFIEGPNAEISGNAATVTGETRATLTGEVQHNEGTWYLVQEDDRWKIDSWDVTTLSTRST